MLITLAGAVALAAACERRPAPPAASAPRLAAPAPEGQISPDSILALGRAGTYDTTAGADTTLPGGGGRRARVTLQSDTGAVGSRERLAAGVVIGRFINRDTVAIARFGLGARDTVYWYADSSAAGWRSTLVSSRRGARPVTLPLTFQSHPDRVHEKPEARWVTAAGGGLGPWVACNGGMCCSTN